MKRSDAATKRLEDTVVGRRLVAILAAAILTTEGDPAPTSDPPPGDPAPADPPASDPPASDPPPANDDPPPADDLNSLFSPEEIEARKTEATRRAALTDEERAAEDAAKAADSVPEQYADFKVAEGVTLDPEMITEFTPLAKEFGLSQDKAQKLVDLAVKVQQRTMDGIFAMHEERKATWLKEAQEDPEIGADVKKWDPEVAESSKDSVAVRAFNTIAKNNPKLKAAVDELGIGNHPEFLRMFYRIGLNMREDSFELGGDGHGDGSVASTLWPNLK